MKISGKNVFFLGRWFSSAVTYHVLLLIENIEGTLLVTTPTRSYLTWDKKRLLAQRSRHQEQKS